MLVSELDTIRDIEPPAAVRELMDRLVETPSGELAKELERMLQQVLRTECDEDRLVVLLARSTRVESDEAHVLPDGALVVPTPWIMSSRDRIGERVFGEHRDLLTEHDDPRGIPVFPSAFIDMVLTAESYDDALDLLGDVVAFV